MKAKTNASLAEISKVNITLNALIRLGIKLSENGIPYLMDRNTSDPYLKMDEDLQSKTPFYFGPTAKQICTLALAMHQEDQNEFIESDKIDLVNEVLGSYFDSPITNDEVQAFNSTYL